MSESVLSAVVIALGLFLGLLAIAITIRFGLHGFKGGLLERLDKMEAGLSGQLQKIRMELSALRTKQDAIWDILALRSQPNWSGTVTRAMPNLGTVEISANPKERQTQYFVRAQHGTMSEALIELLAKQTGFLDYERQLLDGEAATYLQVDKNALIVNVPAVDPEVTTEFVTKFLEWMDTEYVEKREKVLAEYEAPILPKHQD